MAVDRQVGINPCLCKPQAASFSEEVAHVNVEGHLLVEYDWASVVWMLFE